jgi:phytoene synthase
MNAITTHLPIAQRLALAYAPRQSKEMFSSLFLLDGILSRIVARQREPLIAQIRLAWWREQLSDGALLANDEVRFIARAWTDGREGLIAMIDGWEELLSATPDLLAVANGRSAPFAALARRLGCDAGIAEQASASARRWILVDIAEHLPDPVDGRAALELVQAVPASNTPLPRALRPLSVLDGLARRALRRGSTALLGDRLSPLAALRLGIFGR